MSLATRCTACGTVFRVVQDQLKVSEGWVRCGRCDQVFNAIEGLFDLERDAPPNWVPPPAPPAPPAAQVSAEFAPAPVPPQDEEEVFHLSDDDRIHSRFFQPEQEDVAKTPAQSLAQRDKRDFADARFNDALLGDDGLPLDPTPPARQSRPPRKRKPANSSSRNKPSDSELPPEFVRAAKRRALWQSPAMRVLLLLAFVLLSGSLIGQVALAHRDELAVRQPSLRPGLDFACSLLDCTIGLPHRIEDISVESHALAPANGGAAYRLSLVLRNRGDLPVAMPTVELTLTDANGDTVSRRALSVADFRIHQPALAAQAEVPLHMLLAIDGPRVSGYTVEIFYP